MDMKLELVPLPVADVDRASGQYATAEYEPSADSRRVVYTLATVATRNPALVLASVPMGLLFALQRRASGGIQAPVLSHLTWSVLMLRFLPPLFRDRPSIAVPAPAEGG